MFVLEIGWVFLVGLDRFVLVGSWCFCVLDVDGDEEEQLNYVNEVLILGSCFEVEVFFGGELFCYGLQQVDEQEDCFDDYMEFVEVG